MASKNSKIIYVTKIAIEVSEKLIVQAYRYLTNLVPLLERTPSRVIGKSFKIVTFKFKINKNRITQNKIVIKKIYYPFTNVIVITAVNYMQ